MHSDYTIFVSWQSDIPQVREMLIRCINDQVKKQSTKYDVKVSVDQATRDLPGSPKIEDSIFEKIRNSDIFIADITPIATFAKKRLPNPNVSIELGFAIKTLGWKRIILVAYNDSSWDTTNLPFDINHHRIGLFNEEKHLDLSFEIQSCLEVCLSREPKGFNFHDKPTEDNEKTIISTEPVVFFAHRIGQGFPGLRGLQEITDKDEIFNHLKSFFNCCLRYDKSIGNSKKDPIWWFRDGSAACIDSFRILDENHILLSDDELNIRKLIVYNAGSGEYYRDYIYVECVADPPCGKETHSMDTIKEFVNLSGYYSEEFAVFKPTLDSPEYIISRQEFDDGAAIINGKILPLGGKAKLRIRYLTPYNFIIAAKDSPYNSKEFELRSGEYLNHIQKGIIDFKVFHDFLISLKRRDLEY